MKTWVKIVLAVVVVLILAVVALFVWVRANPLAIYAWTTRANLEASGFTEAGESTSSGMLHWYEAGNGFPLILLHGAGDQAGAWASVAPAFTDEYRVLVADLPGHGTSEPTEGPLPFETVMRGTFDWLDARTDESPAILVGNSMGAWLACLFAVHSPDRVSRVVAVNGGPIRGDQEGFWLTPSNREEARALLDRIRDPASDPVPDWVLDDIVQQTNEGPIGKLSRDVEGMLPYLMDGRLEEITVPVDIVWGESDRLFPADYPDRMLAGLARARLTRLESCGHVPPNECPVQFREILAEVLAEEPPEPTARPETTGVEDPP